MTHPDYTTIVVNKKASQSVAGRPLPPPPDNDDGTTGSILLFYQYKEPQWTNSEHKHMLKSVLQLATTHDIQGRGRVAPEGLNCTLSCRNSRSMRAFCQSLRDLHDVFQNTDFKITDGVPPHQLFKSLSIRKTDELVAYGLAGESKAPSLELFGGTHLEAHEYHEFLQRPDTVVIDVRNAYETTVGHLDPPEDGATRIDPKLRHSNEFPAWLHQQVSQQEENPFHNKNVLMYCTGGIRCERATALMNQITTQTSACAPKGVYHMQGGIERYLQTFPTGGYWKGKNYLFDRRMEQTPVSKDAAQVENEIQSQCAGCLNPCSVYRGQYQCDRCKVPVIVCGNCRLKDQLSLECDLCRQHYPAPAPDSVDLVRLKRTAEANIVPSSKKKCKHDDFITLSDWLFLRRLPLIITKSKLESILGCQFQAFGWLTDATTGSFYGSCVLQVESKDIAARWLERKLAFGKRRVKVALVRYPKDSTWPRNPLIDTEFPPLGQLQ